MSYSHVFALFANNLDIFISQGGYFFLIIFTVLEGIPILGMAIPGHIAIIIGGFLARIGTLNLTWVIVLSIIGAVAGDSIGYYLGKRYGMTFIDRLRPYFFITDAHIDKARLLLSKHTGKALIIGRFTPATRSLMPFLVGTMNTPVKKFWFFNIIGGICWVVASVMLGYIFGAAYHLVARYIGRILLISILTAVIIIWGYRFINSRFHIFKRYELFTLILNVLSLWSIAAIVDRLSDNSFRLTFDVWVNIFMDKFNHLHPYIVSIAYMITEIGGTTVIISLGAIVGIYYLLKRKWRSAVIMLLAIGGTGFMTGFLKELFMSSRPANALEIIINDPSFPSGHASMAAAFFVILAYLLAPKIHSWVKRELMIVFCVLAIILIGISRLVLNVHWFSDVLAGWSLGIFIATSSILLVRYISVLFIRKKY